MDYGSDVGYASIGPFLGALGAAKSPQVVLHVVALPCASRHACFSHRPALKSGSGNTL
jgi:hypothetical protein